MIVSRLRYWTGLALAAGGLFMQMGCTPTIQAPPVQTCLSQATAAQIVLDLEAQRDAVVPMRSSGSCRIRWIGPDHKLHEENPSIDIRFVPPNRFFLRGNILGSETIRIGSNAEEFWLAAPPKEISSYWWGRRDRLLLCPTQLWLNPAVLLECCGMYDLEGPWMLNRQPGWDVLVRNDDLGRPGKRLYVGTCDRRIGRIEYLNEGKVVLALSLQDYPEPGRFPCVPSLITLEGIDPEAQASAILSLQNMAVFEPTETQLKGKLFARPQPQGYARVYELSESCEFLQIGNPKEEQ